VPDASRLQDFWRGLELKGQVTIVASAIAVIAAAFFLHGFAGRPSYTTLASGLQPADSGDVTHALESAGIGYRLGGGGTSVSVPEGDVAAARVALAKQGLPRGSHVGFELFDKKSLGVTDFQQKVDYQRALEGEIARTIEQIDGVQGAQVQLVLPDDSLFADQGPKASAAVLLTTSGLDSSTVRAVAHLVASSVKGLNAPDVTITDSGGELLWPTSDSGTTPSSASRLQSEQLYAGQLASQVNALLTATLGANKAESRVHATLAMDQTTLEKVTYGKKGIPLQQQSDTETLGGKGGAAAGGAGTAAGTTGNTATYGGTGTAAGAAGSSNYNHKTDSTIYGVDKTIERTTVAPGAVQKLDVALLVDTSVPPQQIDSLKQAVGAMVGIDSKRGDTLSVSRLTFAPVKASKPASAGPLGAVGSPIALAKKVFLAIAALVFLMMMRKGLKRREEDGVVPEPTWLREIEASVPLAELEAAPTARIQIDPEAARRGSMKNELEEIARSQPQQVATQVTQWMKE
jgi:flagellar M-ring protein FliF